MSKAGSFLPSAEDSTVCYALKRVAALREDNPEVDGLLTALAEEIRTVAAEGTGEADRPTRTPAGGKDLRFNDAFLDALADRLALRIFSRAQGIHGSE